LKSGHHDFSRVILPAAPSAARVQHINTAPLTDLRPDRHDAGACQLGGVHAGDESGHLAAPLRAAGIASSDVAPRREMVSPTAGEHTA
jgi:hypothetical protein